jgi:hypothetical protein
MFGDSITVSQAFWTPLAYDPKNLAPDGVAALDRVKKHMWPTCWREWRGAEFGNDGGKTIAWAAEHVDEWLKKLNPETVVFMFGTNDVGAGVTVEAYAETTRRVVQKCLDNGSVVILTTIPPRSGSVEQTERFAAAARRISFSTWLTTRRIAGCSNFSWGNVQKPHPLTLGLQNVWGSTPTRSGRAASRSRPRNGSKPGGTGESNGAMG